jgi:hypothetical protein
VCRGDPLRHSDIPRTRRSRLIPPKRSANACASSGLAKAKHHVVAIIPPLVVRARRSGVPLGEGVHPHAVLSPAQRLGSKAGVLAIE